MLRNLITAVMLAATLVLHSLAALGGVRRAEPLLARLLDLNAERAE